MRMRTKKDADHRAGTLQYHIEIRNQTIIPDSVSLPDQGGGVKPWREIRKMKGFSKETPGGRSWTCSCWWVLLLVGLLACAQEPLPPRAGSQVIAFGDSLVRGKGASPGKNWVSRLSRQLGITILNKGRNGETTRSALGRLEQDVLSQDPRIVILVLGGNDVLRRLPKKETFKNLGMMIDRIQEIGAAVVLVGVRGGLIGDPYEDSFESLAHSKRTYYVSDIMEGIWGNPAWLTDTVHPNDQGYRHMAERIGPVLTRVLNH